MQVEKERDVFEQEIECCICLNYNLYLIMFDLSIVMHNDFSIRTWQSVDLLSILHPMSMNAMNQAKKQSKRTQNTLVNR
jgi:hypothetical protein